MEGITLCPLPIFAIRLLSHYSVLFARALTSITIPYRAIDLSHYSHMQFKSQQTYSFILRSVCVCMCPLKLEKGRWVDLCMSLCTVTPFLLFIPCVCVYCTESSLSVAVYLMSKLMVLLLKCADTSVITTGCLSGNEVKAFVRVRSVTSQLV